MDLANVFYTLGIIFFVVLTIVLIVLTWFIFFLYKQVKYIRELIEVKVEHVVESIKSTKAFALPIGATLITFIMNMLKKKYGK